MASASEKLIYFLMGGFLGATIGLLFAPRSGQETRDYLEGKYREGTERLAEKTREGRELITEKSKEVANRVTGTFEKGKETLTRQKEQLAAAIDAGRHAYQQEKQKLEPEHSGSEAGEE